MAACLAFAEEPHLFLLEEFALHVRFFVVGFPKSGTSTIHKAFREAGMRSVHEVGREGFCGQVIYRDFRAGNNPLQTLRRYHVITQADVCRPEEVRDGEVVNFWPQLDFEVIQAIESFNPGMKFILNRRDPDALIRSISNWAAFRNRLIRADIPGLPSGVGRSDVDFRAWIEGHYSSCAEHFAGKSTFLEFDIADPAAHQKLQDFVEVELPWWGVENANPRLQEST